MRVLVAGSSGLVGVRLCAALHNAGHQVVRLVRRQDQTSADALYWDPDHALIDAQAIEGVDAVVNLCGTNVAEGRWTERRKEAIRDSRVRPTTLLARTIASMSTKPKVLVNASAIGFYQASDVPVDETSAPANDFLGEVCRAWEASTGPAAQAGVRVVMLRIGVVLAAEGGALSKMLPIFRLGLGGKVGNGEQMMSWVALDDLVAMILFVLSTDTLHGPVNAVAPHPVNNQRFTTTLAEVLGRPALFPVPAMALKIAFGEMGERLLLEGIDVRPAKLEQAGFQFAYRDLKLALEHALK